MTDQRYLVLFDADRIAGYVFDTGRLKEIRGGSFTVHRATHEDTIIDLARLHDPQAEVLFAGGGSGLVRFTSGEAAEAFVAGLQRHYRQATVSGTLSAVSVPYPGNFADTVEQAHIALRRRKSAEPQSDHQFAANPYTAICVSCGRRPVCGLYQVAPGRVERLCAACLTRRSTSDELNEEAQAARGAGVGGRERSVTLSDLAAAGDRFAEVFLDAAADPRWNNAWLPDELDDLGELSTPRNYLGFIHADGNRMGEHLRNFSQQLQDQGKSDEELEQAYGDFSQTIGDVTRRALALALLGAYPDGPPGTSGDRRVPFDNVLLAGDDMILLVTAHKAMDVAADFCRRFQDLMTEAARGLDYEEDITTAAGVVLANVSQPILYLQQQAKGLQREAKGLSARRLVQDDPVSTVDFTVVTTPVLRPLRTIRRHDYTQVLEGDNKLRLTRRPYTAAELRELLALGRRLKGLVTQPDAPADIERRSYPRSQLHTLYDAIFQGYDQALLQGARARLRVNPYQRELLQSFAAKFDALDQLPWAPATEPEFTFVTPFTDLVEVYDFLRDKGLEGHGRETGPSHIDVDEGQEEVPDA